MTETEALAEEFPAAAEILREAGWTPHDGWNVFTRGTLVMGFTPDGMSFHVKDWAKIAPGHKRHDADTPDTPEEAAAWLVERFKPVTVELTAAPDVTLEPPRVDEWPEPRGVMLEDGDSQSLFGKPAEAAYGGEDETHGETGEAEGSADELDEAGRDNDPQGDSGNAWPRSDPDGSEIQGSDEASVLDADFAPIEDEPPERDALDADLIPLRGIAWDENTVADEEAAASTEGPIAYAASDLDALVREKLGRVSQIARELKAALQDGWTIDEFRSLQNLIVRIDRGEATDDAQARARFVAISERSQAMSRVDAHRDALEAALDAIGKARDYQGAVDFNPEAGWP